jgi:hypothetical protein
MVIVNSDNANPRGKSFTLGVAVASQVADASAESNKFDFVVEITEEDLAAGDNGIALVQIKMNSTAPGTMTADLKLHRLYLEEL